MMAYPSYKIRAFLFIFEISTWNVAGDIFSTMYFTGDCEKENETRKVKG
jgi:hypothetical protein